MKISKTVASMENELARVRRDLHSIPEPAWTEIKTSEYIKKYLEILRPDSVETLCKTGVKAVFYAKNAQKTIAFRSDIDALPVQEQNAMLGYRSVNQGAMHACGHDGHMSTLLCLANIVSRKREALQYNVVFLFQPAEEADGGALPLIQAGALQDPKVDEIYGMHVWPYIPAGKIGLKAGALMSNMCDIDITITGVGTHGARPQNGVDALVAAAQFISQAQTIVARNIDPYDMAVVTFGQIQGGEARNVLCESVSLKGTVRTFDDKITDAIIGRLKDILAGLEAGMKVKTELKLRICYPPVVNPAVLVDKAKGKFVGEEDCFLPVKEVMIAEDFSNYQQKIPGLFVFLGIQDEEFEEPLHSNKFNFDESNLLYGLEFMARMIDVNG